MIATDDLSLLLMRNYKGNIIDLHISQKKQKCYFLMVSNSVICKPKSYLNPGPIISTFFIDVQLVTI